MGDRGPDRPQLLLDRPRLRHVHAQQGLLPDRARLQGGIGEAVAAALIALQQWRLGQLRGVQQVVDHRYQAIIEIPVRTAQIDIRLLDQRIEALVRVGRRRRVERSEGLHIGRIARCIGRGDAFAALARLHPQAAR